MIRIVLRVFLVLALVGIAMSYADTESNEYLRANAFVLVLLSIFLAGAAITVDFVIPRKSLQALSGIFFGLTAGLLITYGLTFVVDMIVTALLPRAYAAGGANASAIALTKVLMGVICCYFCVSFVLQTKDDIRFVIPYVEFAKQLKGEQPLILDTSVIIDGRIADICETGIIDQRIIVPRFVLHELQAVADSNDKLKRNRGRRGLDVLNRLQSNEKIDISVSDTPLLKQDRAESVDHKLLALAQQMNGRVATNDYNLNKIAQIRGVTVININDLANAMKPVALPGEMMMVRIIKAGEEPQQGVGYLDDGTMVVVEQGRGAIGSAVDVAVTSVLQTSAGRMIFGRLENGPAAGRRREPDPHGR